MEELFFNFIDQFGYFAVGALIFIENIFPPIPSELILPLGGFFTRRLITDKPFHVTTDLCTGCGLCANVCPKGAIEVRR